jgi:hypothetical protein
MVFKAGYVLLAVGALALAAIPSAAKASVSYGFQGTVAERDDFLVLFQFTISEDRDDVFLATLSNGGGTLSSAAAPFGGTPVAAGGFQTQLTLFTAAGYQAGTAAVCGSQGGDACIGTDPTSGIDYSTLDLVAGTYILALTEYGNYSNGNLSDGWTYADPAQWPTGGPFPNPTTGGRFNGNYSVEILNVDGATQLPEPGGFCLFGGGMALIALAFFQRKRARLAAAATGQD